MLKNFDVTIPGAGRVKRIVCLSEEDQLSLGTPKIVTSFRVEVTYVTEDDVAKTHNYPTISITHQASHGTSLSCLADNLRYRLLKVSNTTLNKRKRAVDGVYCE